MKVAAFLVALTGVAASTPNKAIGTKLGDILAAGAGDEAFKSSYENEVLAQTPVLVNPAVTEAIRAANSKAAKMSFLKAPSSVTLHVADSPDYEATAASELAYAQRKKLMKLLKSEAAEREILANALAAQSTGFEATTSFIQQPAESAAAVLGDVQYQGTQFGYMMKSIGAYKDAINAGGYQAARAISALTNALSEPNAKMTSQLISPAILSALRSLMLKESTPDQLRTAAGSIITQVTGLPVSSTAVDTSTGAYGHVNIVMPKPSRVYGADYAVLASKAGAGSYYPTSFLKKKEFPFKLPDELVFGDVNKGASALTVVVEKGEDAEGAEMLKSLK